MTLNSIFKSNPCIFLKFTRQIQITNNNEPKNKVSMVVDNDS